MWAVDFNGPVRAPSHFRPHRGSCFGTTYGNVTAVASDNSAITITKDFPFEPPTRARKQAIASSQSFSVLADSTNGTLFYDLDGKTTTKITNFSAEASSIVDKYVHVAAKLFKRTARLVAVRI